MLFNSYAFLIFLPLFMLGYWSTRGRARLWVMFLFSLVFYGWWDWRFLFLLLFSAIVDYSIGIVLENEQRDSARHRLIVLSVIVNLGLLGFFKYFNFFADSTARICESFGLPVTWNTLQIILPVGISFYVFKTMSYTIDVYRRTQTAERDLLKFATFVVFFPELVAGPIVRASRLLPQLKQDQRFDYERALSGISLICSGYVRKVVVADSLAPIVDVRFAHPEAHSALSLLIGVYFYAFQIYCDFSGYSNIAIGIARILGFDFGINFERPYFSRSFSEFWTRWHISLSSWLRDYLYIPLGGSRGGSLFTFRNLMLTMLLGGLWHGARWTFVAWGGLHGLYLVGQRIVGPLYQRIVSALRIPRFLSSAFLILLVFHLTCFAWIFFRAQSFELAWQMITNIAAMRDVSFATVDNKLLVLKGAMLIAGLLFFELLSSRASSEGPVRAGREDRASLPTHPGPSLNARDDRGLAVRHLLFAASCIWILLLFGSFSGNTFIYFQF